MARPETLDLSRLLSALSTSPAKPGELAKRLGVSRATVHRKLEKLLEDDVAVRVGEGPVAAYRLPSPAEALAKAQADASQHGQVRVVMSALTAGSVQEALETFSRLGIGQFHEIASRARFGETRHADGTPFSYDELDELDQLANTLKFHLLGLETNASYGIYSPHVHVSVKQAWALQRALRHRMAWDRQPKGGMGVAHDEPLGDDRLPGVVVHSDQPDEKGLPTRYVLELPTALVGVLVTALRTAFDVSTGNVQVLVQMARDQVLRASPSGSAVSDEALQNGAVLAGRLQSVLSGVKEGAYNAALTERQAQVFEALRALEQFQASASQEVSAVTGVTPLGVSVGPVGDSPWAMSLDKLPPGMMLNYQHGKYRVIAPRGEDQLLTIVAESHSLETVLLMARNVAEGARARSWSI